MKFIGRLHEIELLNNLKANNKANLVAISGRRRVGKSRLIAEFGKGKTFYSFYGNPPTSDTNAELERKSFSLQIEKTLSVPIKYDNWYEMLVYLAKATANQEVVILFDELSWISSCDSSFLGTLKTVWDEYFSKNNKLTLVLCGSISSWIERNVLSSTGFLGRLSMHIHLKELSLSESNEFFGQHQTSAYEKLKILSVTGGVPRYLEEMQYNHNAEFNIKKLCFSSSGILFKEFDHIFSDLFASKNVLYQKIIESLIDGSKTRSEISSSTKLEENGVLTDYLYDLEKAGFISRYNRWNIGSSKYSNLATYRISDNYSRFFLKYIKPQTEMISSDIFELISLESLPNWNSIMGLQFEAMVLNNAKVIIEKLKITASTICNAGPYFEKTTKNKKGVQVDYMIQTKLNELYICEVKYSKNPVGLDIIEEMKDKISRISIPKNFSIRPILIVASGITDELEDSGYFVQILDFGRILENLS